MAECAASSYEANCQFTSYFLIKKVNTHFEVRQGVAFQLVLCNPYEARRFFIDYYCQNSECGMGCFHFIAPESQIRELTQVLCMIFACLLDTLGISSW